MRLPREAEQQNPTGGGPAGKTGFHCERMIKSATIALFYKGKKLKEER